MTAAATPNGVREMSHLFRTHYLVFNHFHADLEAFSTDITDNLIFVSEFSHLRHQIGAHMKTVVLCAILSDSLKRNEFHIKCAAFCSTSFFPHSSC